MLQGISEYMALQALGLAVSWDGRHVVAPPGTLDEAGMVDLALAKQI